MKLEELKDKLQTVRELIADTDDGGKLIRLHKEREQLEREIKKHEKKRKVTA